MPEIKPGDRVFVVWKLNEPIHCEVEGTVDHLTEDGYVHLTDGTVVPQRSLCLVPEGHVFAADQGTIGKPNPCLVCGCEIIVPYRGPTEGQKG